MHNNQSITKLWWEEELHSYTYVGWRGVGPIFGTRYYLYIGDDAIKMLSRSLLGKIVLHTFPVTAVLCTRAKRPSFSYSLFGAIVAFFGDPFKPRELHDNLEIFYSEGWVGLGDFLLSALFVSVIFGVIIDRLFERPRIQFILEGGAHIGTFTNFNKSLPQVIRLISKTRGLNSSESMRSKHRYYNFQGRAI